MPSSMRRKATTRKKPTPAATERMSVMLGMEGTWLARTCKSGSEMVMRKPSAKPTPMMRGTLRLRVSTAPTRSPMGLMLISAPRVKNMMPTMIMAAPSRKQSRMLGETGAMEKQSTSTIATMGSTACNASSSFSRSLGSEPLRIVSTDLSGPVLRRNDKNRYPLWNNHAVIYL